jgi:hypothetical protein
MAMDNVYTGANGTLTLATENTPDRTPEGQDAKIAWAAYSKTLDIGRVTGVQIYVQTTVQEYYQIGQRFPVSLNPENIAISGEVDRAYINGALLFLLLGRGAGPTAVKEPYAQPTFTMKLTLRDPAVPANKASLELKGVKFLTWGVSVPEDDFVMENVKFKALTISVVDSEKPPTFPKG